jgi:glucose-1-phosphate thymidylyltransferase
MSKIIGLIPAAGNARRLGDISLSKEILPVAFESDPNDRRRKARPACHHLLEGMVDAGVNKALMVLRTGKWDIPASLSRDPVAGIELSFVVIEETAGVPWTLDHAYSFIMGSDVVMGFPDILIRPRTLYRDIVDRLRSGTSDVVLGVVPTNRPEKVDVVEMTEDGRVVRIRPKPKNLSSAKAWIAAAWRPSFTGYIHDFLANHSGELATPRELYLGDIVAASLDHLHVSAVQCDEGMFIDIGTPDDLASVSPT